MLFNQCRHDPNAAQRIAQRFLERLENLVVFPRMSVAVRSAPDPESVRDIILDNYVIRYSGHLETIVILPMWHHLEERYWKSGIEEEFAP